MENRKLKKIMIDVAKGKISQKEADILINPKKVVKNTKCKKKK